MRQEIVSNKEAEEDEVVNELLQVKLERQLQILELKVEVLAHYSNLDELELCDSGKSGTILRVASSTLGLNVTLLTTLETLHVLWRVHGFSENVEIRLMRRQTKHDKVSVCSMDAVTRVLMEARLSSLRSDKVKNLVLTFTGDESIRENDSKSHPERILITSLQNVGL